MIDFDKLFARIGKCIYVGNLIVTANKTTIPAGVNAFLALIYTDTSPTFIESIAGEIDAGVAALKATTSPSVTSLVKNPIENLIVETVKADKELLSYSLKACLDELVQQMKDNSETLDKSTITITTTYGEGVGSSSGVTGDNTGDGVLLFSTKRPDGLVNEHIFSETLTAKITSALTDGSATWKITGEEALDNLNVDWPGGSGASVLLTSHTASSDDNLVDGSFDTVDASAANLPSGWMATTATMGTTLVLTSVEKQTVDISGTPTGGWYALKFTAADGTVYTTSALAYNASTSDVQTALRAIPGLTRVSVSTTGTTPNFKHTIKFIGTRNPNQLTNIDNLTGGSAAIVNATTVAGSIYTSRGSRCIKIAGDGSELTALQTPVDLEPGTAYGVCIWACTDSAPSTGTIVVDFADGSTGAAIADDEGTANTLSIDCTTLTATHAAFTAMFRTPSTIPQEVYVRIRVTSAIENTKNVFLDELTIIPATRLYSSGIWACAFSGPTNFAVDDQASIVVTNDYGGEIHKWLNRVCLLSNKHMLFPTATAPATQPDTLIA